MTAPETFATASKEPLTTGTVQTGHFTQSRFKARIAAACRLRINVARIGQFVVSGLPRHVT